MQEIQSSRRVLARQLDLFDEHNLTDAEARFADVYIVTRSAADAYIAANGPETKRNAAYRSGKKWLGKEPVKRYIEQRQRELALEIGLTQEEVIAYLRTVVLIGLGRRKVRKTVFGKDGAIRKPAEEIYEPSLSAANSAAQGLAKFLGVDQNLAPVNWIMNLGAPECDDDASPDGPADG